jgi:hypothetical protein
MHEIICPHCDKAFKVDESGYAEILKQVRDEDFQKQLHERLELAERDKQNAVELAKAKVSSDSQKTAAAKDAEIQELKSKLEASEVTQKLAVTEALGAIGKERDRLANALAQAERERKLPLSLLRRFWPANSAKSLPPRTRKSGGWKPSSSPSSLRKGSP